MIGPDGFPAGTMSQLQLMDMFFFLMGFRLRKLGGNGGSHSFCLSSSVYSCRMTPQEGTTIRHSKTLPLENVRRESQT